MTQSSYDNESQLEPIYDKIQQLDKKLQNLEKSSQKVIVTGGKKDFQPKPLFVSQEELINLYNYLPNILLEYITPVSITADTYRAKTNNNIYLEYNLNGHYWVILTEYESHKNYWLVPNANRKNNFHRLQDRIKSLFIIQGDLNSYNYTLEKLAGIEILADGLKWYLIEKGYLQIGKTSPIEQLIKKLEKLKTENGEIPQNIIGLVESIDLYYQKTLNIEKEQKELTKAVVKITDIIITNNNKLTKTTNKLEQTIHKLEKEVYQTIDHNQQQNLENLATFEQNFEQKIKIISTKVSENYQEKQILRDDYEKLNKDFKQQQRKVKNINSNLGCLNFLLIVVVLVLSIILINI